MGSLHALLSKKRLLYVNTLNRHNVPVSPNLLNNFHVLTKCKDKFDSLIKLVNVFD